jgi:hypothetical protein
MNKPVKTGQIPRFSVAKICSIEKSEVTIALDIRPTGAHSKGGGEHKQAKCRQISVWMGLSLLREQGGFGS